MKKPEKYLFVAKEMMQLVERIILKVLVRVGVDGKVEKIGVTV